MHMGKLFRVVSTSIICAAVAGGAMLSAQTKKSPAAPQPAASATTFRGGLQGDSTKGFALLSPTGNGSDNRGQMKTYKVVPASRNVTLNSMANKVVEVT